MGIKIKIGEKERESNIKFNLEIRKALNGDILIFDHEDIDISLSPSKGKVITFAKEIMDDKIYNTQNRLMKYLTRKGVIDPATIRVGNVYSSLEAKIYESQEKINAADVTLLNVAKWIEDERPYFMYHKASEEQEQDLLLNPDEEHSTELGEVPQSANKGSMPTNHAYYIRENKFKF